eukprot:376174-Rhodomonas_salina.1
MAYQGIRVNMQFGPNRYGIRNGIGMSHSMQTACQAKRKKRRRRLTRILLPQTGLGRNGTACEGRQTSHGSDHANCKANELGGLRLPSTQDRSWALSTPCRTNRYHPSCKCRCYYTDSPRPRCT